ncbi:hypothetical protein SAMN04487930_101464 [Cytophaga hutchinsonii ATCC 33406]|nr:hypothetical protein SAMN04487930_101464 [Cytophaga hutchinsonii ATCC 33406]
MDDPSYKSEKSSIYQIVYMNKCELQNHNLFVCQNIPLFCYYAIVYTR